ASAAVRLQVGEIERVDGEERRSHERCSRDAVARVGDGAQPEQEAPLEGVFEEKTSPARGGGDSHLIEGSEEARQGERGQGEHRDIAVADAAPLAYHEILDLAAASLDEVTQVEREHLPFEVPVVVRLCVRAGREIEGQDFHARLARQGLASGEETSVV